MNHVDDMPDFAPMDEMPRIGYGAAAAMDSMLETLAVPSHSLEAEQSVLGGLMLDNGAWEVVCETLAEADFYRQDHRLIFGVIAGLLNKGDAVDVITTFEALGKQAAAVGGLSYLGMLANNTPSAANIKHYAKLVHGHAVRRGVQGEVHALNRMLTEGVDTGEVLEHGARRFTDLSLDRAPVAAVGMKQLLARLVDKLDERFQNPDVISGLPTPWIDINNRTQGLQPGDLVIVAGRPSMGKTTFAMNMAEHCAVVEQKPVVVFSMEMPADQLALRMLASLGRVDFGRLRKGDMQDEDWPKFAAGVGKLSEARLFIDDQGGLSPAELRGRARRFAREHGALGMVVVDYLQLMQVPGYTNNRVGEISEISRSLKSLAKELNAPVVALSQLNRGLEQRTNKRPLMADLRDSGAIEQDADVIFFIYRDEVYNQNSEDRGTAEIITGKQRNGEIGMDRLTFLGRFQCFENGVVRHYSRGGEPQAEGERAGGGFE